MAHQKRMSKQSDYCKMAGVIRKKGSWKETEIIDIRREEELTSLWKDFIHSHHYRVRTSFYESYIAKHPRRSCEALWQQLAMARFVNAVDFPKTMDFTSLYSWLQPRVAPSKNSSFRRH
jgi:hypothetical protein